MTFLFLTWMFMLVMGNLGFHLSFWTCVPAGIILAFLTPDKDGEVTLKMPTKEMKK